MLETLALSRKVLQKIVKCAHMKQSGYKRSRSVKLSFSLTFYVYSDIQ